METVAIRNDDNNRKKNLDDTLCYFLSAINNEECNPDFYATFNRLYWKHTFDSFKINKLAKSKNRFPIKSNKYVKSVVSSEDIENAHKELLVLIENPSLLKPREFNFPFFSKKS